MAANITELQTVLSKMESSLKSITECGEEVLEFIIANYPDMLNNQKVVQEFKNVSDAEDELQRRLNFLRQRLTTGISEFK